MTEAIEYEQFDQAEQRSADASTGMPAGADLRRLSEVPMELSVEIGRTGMTVGETLDLHVGSVIKLDRLAGEPVDLLVNGTPIARGEVVVVEEQFGLRVTEILESADAPPSDAPPSEAAASEAADTDDAAPDSASAQGAADSAAQGGE